MKEFRGTPGEWSFKPSIPEEGFELFWLYADKVNIGHLNGPQNEEVEANARLWAASKDLLEALQGMMEFAGIIEERLGTAETDKARAAIRKVLGE